MPDALYKRLIARIPEKFRSGTGVTVIGIQEVVVTKDLVEEVIESVSSADSADITFGLFFFESLCGRSNFNGLIKPVLPTFTQLVRSLLLHHPDYSVRSASVRSFACLRAFYPDYKEVMCGLLTDVSSQLQWDLLPVAQTFLDRSDLGLFRALQSDSAIMETGGMGGPRRYLTRDFALETAERIAGCKFAAPDCSEVVDGNLVSWRSWDPFIRWLHGQRLIH